MAENTQDTLQDTLNEVIEPSTTAEDAFAFPMTPEDSSEEVSNDPVTSAFTEPEGAEPSTQEAPQEEIKTEDNEERRYQYWQSEADKAKNQLAQRENEMREMQQRLYAGNQPNQPQEQKQEFPDAPGRPEKPRGFSREEAFTDPNSESGQYLDAMEDWRDKIDEYRDLRNQYDTAVLQERFEAQDEQRKQQEIQRQQYASEMAKKQEVYEHVQGHYGLTDTDAREFIETMSQPESLTMDNLVALYRIQKGNGQTVAQNAPAQPSDAFKQTQNAQQVPSPMGVIPSSNTSVDGKSAEDKIMDNIIGDFKSRNPF